MNRRILHQIDHVRCNRTQFWKVAGEVWLIHGETSILKGITEKSIVLNIDTIKSEE